MLDWWLLLAVLAALFAATFEFIGRSVSGNGAARIVAGGFLVLFLLGFVAQTSGGV